MNPRIQLAGSDGLRYPLQFRPEVDLIAKQARASTDMNGHQGELSMLQRVDLRGETIGLIEKIEAHRGEGILHRAVSVLLLNDQGQMLIQRRSGTKYHFGGYWANACCTHPFPEESIEDAGKRALVSELGVQAPVREVMRFTYKAHDPVSGLTEYEYDHVLIASWSGDVYANPDEVEAVEWVQPEALAIRLSLDTESFAFWFVQILRELAFGLKADRTAFSCLEQFIDQLRPMLSS